ncbi:MAG: hypothetical protein JSV23_09095 [Promethearchaeota archaeon]|nr:MAG: hypothetical protein JSV23_09095 [Candidatus Lokiarchaeota archaeon]
MTEKKDHFMLKWNDDTGQFVPIESNADMNEGIFIELVEEEEKWRYFYIKGASLIARRTALRAANGISKTGYVHPKTNLRYGVDCKLKEEISPYEDMPKDLRKTQRSWYKGEYKQY